MTANSKRRSRQRRSATPRWFNRAIKLGLGLIASATVLGVALGLPPEDERDTGTGGLAPPSGGGVESRRAEAGRWPDRAITLGLAAVMAAAIVAVAVGVSYRARLWILLVALIPGPGCLALRTLFRRYTLGALIGGCGIGVGWLMVAGQAMILAHAWFPVALTYATLGVGLAAAVLLLMPVGAGAR